MEFDKTRRIAKGKRKRKKCESLIEDKRLAMYAVKVGVRLRLAAVGSFCCQI